MMLIHEGDNAKLMLGYQGKVGLVEQLFLTDRFKPAPPANWNPLAGTELHSSQIFMG